MSTRPLSRRGFLKSGSALAGLAAVSPTFPALASVAHVPGTYTPGPSDITAYKYPNPGRIAIVTDGGAVLGLNKVNETVVQRMFDEGIMRFTGITSSPADALASVFPGLTTSSKIAIKPSLLNFDVPTRKELVKAVITRLVQMLGGFPAGNISLYERHNMPSYGMTKTYFGAAVNIVVDSSFPNLGYTILCDGKQRPYSKTLHDADFLINMPVLKDHGCSMDFTLAFKNHMGTVNPGGSLGICSNKKAALDIMADAVLVAKQKLVVMDCLYAVLNGGPGGPVGAVPNTVMISQDPVTNDYQGRKLINEFRKKDGMNAKTGSYIEEASKAPYLLGVANPAEMNVITVPLTTEADTAPVPIDWTLSEAYPNPFTDSAQWLLELPAERHVVAEIISTDGAVLSVLRDASCAPGTTTIDWRPRAIAAGLYLLRVRIGSAVVTRKAIYHAAG